MIEFLNSLHPVPPAILLGLIILVPRVLEMVRIPMPLSALALGVAWASHVEGPAAHQVVEIVATVAITMLFLFAGLEVDTARFRSHGLAFATLGVGHLVMMALLAAGVGWALDLAVQPAAILAIGLATPSAGYILDSLARSPLSPDARASSGNLALGLEVVSLAALVVVLNLQSPRTIVLTVGLLALAFLLIPPAWRLLERGFFARVATAEFVSLFMLAMMLSHASKAMGLYYIVGAFMTGLVIGELNRHRPGSQMERHIGAIEMITALALPVYFFRAGSEMPIESIDHRSLLVGLAMLGALVLRLPPVAIADAMMRRAPWRDGLRVALSVAPTLVFGLVIADILRATAGVPAWLPGAVIVHTVLVTLLPSFVLGTGPVAEMDVFHGPAPRESHATDQ